MKNVSLTAEQIYRQNKRKHKLFSRLSPIIFYLFLALALVFFILTIKNSIGNVIEILHLLDDDIYSGEQIAKNYEYLVNKWGEWEIVGAGSAGLVIRYVDVRTAMFSGLMITYTILCIISILCAVIFGKILFPQMAKLYKNNNDEMVDVATLKSAQQIEEFTRKKNKDKEEWF